MELGKDCPPALHRKQDALSRLFRNLHESLLNELRRPRHGIRVDFDAGEQIGIAPVVSLRGRPAQLDAHTALHRVCHKVLIGIAGRDVSIGVVGGIV